MAANAAGVISGSCDWCGEAPWLYSCGTCDHRKTKLLCKDCAARWHSRGFSQQHVLEDRGGTKKTHEMWVAHRLSESAAGNAVADAVSSPVKKTPPHQTYPESEIVAETASEETQEEVPAIVPAVAAAAEREDADNVEYGSGGEAEDEDATQEEPQEIPMPLTEETELELEDVLDRLPSEAASILDALAGHIHAATRVEDARLCDHYVKCKEASCQRYMLHYGHVKERKMCSDSLCQSIASYESHMEFCRRESCPFCVRIKQRRLFGKKHGLDYVIQLQGQQLQALRREHGGGQAQINFFTDQIEASLRRKRDATEEVEKLNTLAVEKRLPMFNFSAFSWHIKQEPVIKVEPTVTDEGPSNTSRADVGDDEKKEESDAEAGGGGSADVDLGLGPNADGPASPLPEVPYVDYVSNLIEKKNSGDTTAHEMLEESVRHAFCIVDASFCSPSKAARCLLNCQKILLHLQHHVDSNVCKDRMCETVEHHFAHVSKCQREDTDRTCQYCLRVSEREFARSVEVMEAERVETELKMQHLIGGITESISNDPADEREQNVAQLEDELQQAEEYKKALVSKLDAASLNLLKVRRRMKKHTTQLPSSNTTGLPLHFIKVARHQRQ